MPNYCSNNLTILNGEDIYPYIEKYLIHEDDGDGEVNLDFAKIIPHPTESDNNNDWHTENWGTKWGCGDGYVNHNGGYWFSTAWSPACPIVLELSKLIGQSLRHTYLEEGMGFCGEFIAIPDGTYSDKVYDDLENVPDDLKEELGLNDREDEDEDDDDDEE